MSDNLIGENKILITGNYAKNNDGLLTYTLDNVNVNGVDIKKEVFGSNYITAGDITAKSVEAQNVINDSFVSKLLKTSKPKTEGTNNKTSETVETSNNNNSEQNGGKKKSTYKSKATQKRKQKKNNKTRFVSRKR